MERVRPYDVAAVVDDRLGGVQLKWRQSCEKLFVEDLKFHTSQMRADAAMGPTAEHHVCFVSAQEIECLRVREDIGVEIRRREEQHDVFSLTHPDPVEVHVPGHHAGRYCESIESKYFLDHRGYRFRVGAHFGLKVWVEGEVAHAVTHRVHHGVESRKKQ